MDSGKAADYGVDLLYSIPPADVVPNAVEIVTEPGTGVEIEVVQSRCPCYSAIAIVSHAPLAETVARVEKRRDRHPGKEGSRVAIVLTLDQGAGDSWRRSTTAPGDYFPDGVRGGRCGGRSNIVPVAPDAIHTQSVS